MAFFIEVIILSAAMPAGIAAIALLFKRSAGFDMARGAIASGGALLVVMLALPWMPMVPQRAWQWVGYLAVGAGIVSSFGGRHWLAHVAAVLVCVAAGWLLVPDYAKLDEVRLIYRIATGVTVALVWWSLEYMADRTGPTLTGWLWLAIVLAGAAVLERAGLAKFLQLQTALAAGLGMMAFLGVFRPVGLPLRGAAGPVAVVITGLMVNGWIETFLGVPLLSFLLVILTPMVLSLAALSRWSKRPARQMMFVRLAIAALMLGAAVGIAWLATVAR
ncbi:MAG: hypothetical protein WD768_21335 [Phycisphaeraceae bacterium]